MRYDENRSRSNYYGINGVVDVLTSMKINKTLEQSTLDTYNNKIIEILKKNEDFQKMIEESEDDEYEIIIDYKGMKDRLLKLTIPNPKINGKVINSKY